MENKLITTTEAAKILGISRVAVFNKVKSGEIQAEKVGRDYLIKKNDLPNILTKSLSAKDKKTIENLVEKVVNEYGEALRLLGKE